MSVLLRLALPFLCSCALVVSFDDHAPPPHLVRGTVSGLGTATLTLHLNGVAHDVKDGPFVFPIDEGAKYVFAINAQPPGRHCSMAGAEGVIEGFEVTGVVVRCFSL